MPPRSPFGGVRSQIRWEWLRALLVTWLMLQLGLKPQTRAAPAPAPAPVPVPVPPAPRRSPWVAVRRTAALVAPDQTLARRVAAKLARWGVAADSSAGLSLSGCPSGVLAGLGGAL